MLGHDRKWWGARALGAALVLTGAGTTVGATPLPGLVGAAAPGVACEVPMVASAFDLPGPGGELPVRLEATDPIDLGQGTRAAAVTSPVSIPVWFHVITPSSTPTLLSVSDEQLARQLAVLNDSFAGETGGASSPFSFVHAGTDRTANDAWTGAAFDYRTPAEEEAKAALRKGDVRTLNVYITQTADGSSWATFPWSYRHEPTRDGIVVDTDQVTGPLGLAPEGDTAVHETGHWLGLYHTFQGYDFVEEDGGGCAGSGDYVADTPAEDVPSTSECAERDTCPTSAGLDPIHNFMDYSGDVCTFEFTAGQVQRMSEQWSTYRAASTKPGKGRNR